MSVEDAATSYEGSCLNELRAAMQYNPYSDGKNLLAERLPHQPIVDINYLKSQLWNPKRKHYLLQRKILERHSARILDDRRDLMERSPHKVVHSNGISFIGEWRIDEDCGLTGYFSAGAHGLFVGRASMLDGVILKAPKVHRTIGFAGKILPTPDPTKRVQTANFVMIDSFLGHDRYYLEGCPTNNPAVTELSAWGSLKVGLRDPKKLVGLLEARDVFDRADTAPLYRPLGEISHLGLPKSAPSRTPLWMRIEYQPGTTPIQKHNDFRQELWETLHANNGLTFIIQVSEKNIVEDAPDQVELIANTDLSRTLREQPSFAWKPIGRIILKEAFVSEGADHRIRFHHPRVIDPAFAQG